MNRIVIAAPVALVIILGGFALLFTVSNKDLPGPVEPVGRVIEEGAARPETLQGVGPSTARRPLSSPGPSRTSAERRALNTLGAGESEVDRAAETGTQVSTPRRRRKPGLGGHLGLEEGDDRARFLQTWLTRKGELAREYLPGGSQARGKTVAQRARGFNQAAADAVRELREGLGEFLAGRVAARVPLHRMDPATGEIYRVDLYGRRLAQPGGLLD